MSECGTAPLMVQERGRAAGHREPAILRWLGRQDPRQDGGRQWKGGSHHLQASCAIGWALPSCGLALRLSWELYVHMKATTPREALLWLSRRQGYIAQSSGNSFSRVTAELVRWLVAGGSTGKPVVAMGSTS